MGLAITGAQYLWPGGRIPYVIDPQLPGKNDVEAAILHWNQRTVVRFVLRTSEADHVLLTRSDGAAISDVGRLGIGQQKVSLADNCPVGSIIHELGHTIGLWHEHCRHDRDQFVTVLIEDIKEENRQQFTIDSIAEKPTATSDIDVYDFGSIMHYSETACAFIDDMPVLIPKHSPLPPGVVQGQRDGLSPGDIAAVEKLYEGVPLLGEQPPAATGPIVAA
jgi:hypothetical protein